MRTSTLIILIAGLAALPVFYLLLNLLADAWERTVGEMLHRKFWPRRYFKPFLVIAGVIHVVMWGVIPLLRH